jgi:hypothetical protein
MSGDQGTTTGWIEKSRSRCARPRHHPT